MNEWISINDKLPETNSNGIAYVLVFDKLEGIVGARFLDRTAIHTADTNAFMTHPGCNNLYHVTHWMPLPDKPVDDLESKLQKQETVIKNLLVHNDSITAELIECKDLLRIAASDIRRLLCARIDFTGYKSTCEICSYNADCECGERCTIIPELRTWRYADKVKKLLGE